MVSHPNNRPFFAGTPPESGTQPPSIARHIGGRRRAGMGDRHKRPGHRRFRSKPGGGAADLEDLWWIYSQFRVFSWET